MVEGYFDRLPCEILLNIALMLPFSSIIQLKCSSKFWYNFLKDSKFADLHLTHALEKPPGYFFTADPQLLEEKNTCHFAEHLEGQLSTSKFFKYSFDYGEPDGWACFQSSGGLMCAYLSQSCWFRIFNPDIGEEIQVPRDPVFKRWFFLNYIFGYSPSIKKYKILKLGELIEKGQGRVNGGAATAEICTLGSNITWREIQNVPTWDIDEYIQCRKGNPFWMKKSDLYFFDLVSETFHVIPGPPLDLVNVTHDHNRRAYFMDSLISMGETVGYVHNNRLWVLEDKTKGIWINRYDFSIPQLYHFAKLCTLENGHLFGFANYPAKVFVYDMGCRGFTEKEINLDEDEDVDEGETRRIEYMVPHVRSFVSPIRIMKMEN